jgi:hypothetical protein
VTPLHAMQFRPLEHARCPLCWPCRSDPGCPLDTAGARSLWHVGGTAGETAMAPSSAEGGIVLGDHYLVTSREGGAAAKVSLWVMSHLIAVPGGTQPTRNRPIR